MSEREHPQDDDRRAASEPTEAQAYEDAWYRALKAKAEQRAAAEAAAEERVASRPE